MIGLCQKNSKLQFFPTLCVCLYYVLSGIVFLWLCSKLTRNSLDLTTQQTQTRLHHSIIRYLSAAHIIHIIYIMYIMYITCIIHNSWCANAAGSKTTGTGVIRFGWNNCTCICSTSKGIRISGDEKGLRRQ